MRVYATAPTMTAKVTAKIGSARAVCCFSACASDAFPSAVKSFCELPENMIYSCCPLSIERLEGARRLLLEMCQETLCALRGAADEPECRLGCR